MAIMVTRTLQNDTLDVHSVSLSILLCLLAFMLQKLLFSGIQRTQFDSPPYRIPLHNELSILPPPTNRSNHVPGSSVVSKELAMFLSRHNVTINNVHYVMSQDLLRLPSSIQRSTQFAFKVTLLPPRTQAQGGTRKTQLRGSVSGIPVVTLPAAFRKGDEVKTFGKENGLRRKLNSENSSYSPFHNLHLSHT
jgi:hypothetical protein